MCPGLASTVSHLKDNGKGSMWPELLAVWLWQQLWPQGSHCLSRLGCAPPGPAHSTSWKQPPEGTCEHLSQFMSLLFSEPSCGSQSKSQSPPYSPHGSIRSALSPPCLHLLPLLPSFSLMQPHWPCSCPTNVSGLVPTQEHCTCRSFFLECFFLDIHGACFLNSFNSFVCLLSLSIFKILFLL